MRTKNIVILGATGSIGVNTLKVVECFPGQFRVVGLSAYNNVELLKTQIKKFTPQYVAVNSVEINYLKRCVNGLATKILDVQQDLNELVKLPEVDVIVIAMRGSAALIPFLTAVRLGKTVAPANKEALVVAGDIIMAEAQKYNAQIIPIDSEQSAIFQCLNGQDRKQLKKIFLTASGGPLKDVASQKFRHLTLKDILKHPRWKMGKKITVDSATLMNKGFEVIEAQRLFGLTADQIEVVIHPEAIIHSMVEFTDGSILAQLALPDMRLPIQYALTYPDRWSSPLKRLDFAQLKSLNFSKPNTTKFPSLKLCFYVAKKGGTLPAVLNAADEVAVEAFLDGRLDFLKIHKVVEKVVLKHKMIPTPSLKQVLDADQWSRQETYKNLN